jgi:hypothetical protein
LVVIPTLPVAILGAPVEVTQPTAGRFAIERQGAGTIRRPIACRWSGDTRPTLKKMILNS